jgi:hypothetical protein
MVIVAALAVMLIGATALATEDAFADKEKHDDKKDRKRTKQYHSKRLWQC